MENKSLMDVPPMSAGHTVKKLSEAYVGIINKGLPVSLMPSVMLWGPPGIGKSQAVRQIAEEISESTGKETVVTDVRLLLFNPIDLRGIPTANEDKTMAVWLKPKIFQMNESDKVVNILFLDEISAAPQSVQAAAYQITLDRTVGEHRLPENCIVMAAGNRITDRSVVYKMPRALANRLMHLEIIPDFDSWKAWAVQNRIHPKVIGFLSFRRSHLMKDAAGENDLAFPSPRSWEMVSNILKGVNESVSEMFDLIAGVVGTGTAIEFRTWERIYKNLPSIDSIFSGENPELPHGTDAIYALVASMVDYARTHKNDMNAIANSIRYAEKMPPDFSVLLLKDYMYLEKDYKQKLMMIPEFQRWLDKKGGLLNGIA